jgi:hypothetical protein
VFVSTEAKLESSYRNNGPTSICGSNPNWLFQISLPDILREYFSKVAAEAKIRQNIFVHARNNF